MSRLAYVSGPPHQVSDSIDWKGVGDTIQAVLHEAGFDVYLAERAFSRGSRSAAVLRANAAVIGTAQAGVVCLARYAQRMQQSADVERMAAARLPVLLVTDLTDSPQVDLWAGLGATVCRPDSVELALRELAATAASRERKTSMGEALRQAGEKMRQQLGPVPLVFEPVGEDHVDTPSGPQHLLPDRGYEDDAGLDLYVSRYTEVAPYEFSDVPCGVKVDIPAGHWGMITGRSSTLRKRGLLVNPGVIDAGWTGELFAGVQNLTGTTVRVEAGDRLAQLILLPAAVTGREPEWGRVPVKARGTNGFGSTGS